jgi:excisionase family DNA binding protein
MSAYVTPKRQSFGSPLRLELSAPATSGRALSTSSGAAYPGLRTDHGGVGEGTTVELVLDWLADRIVAAVADRVGDGLAEQRDEWLDSREAAEYLGLHRDTLRRLAAARAIPSEQDGPRCKLFFRRAALDEWRQSGGRARHLTAVADLG